MLPLYYLILFSIIQGITEFLPISSSGHLVLMHEFMDGHDAFEANQILEADRAAYNKLLDISMHLGTLLAVCAYFYRDVLAMIFGGFDLLLRRKTQNAHIAVTVIIASFPVIIVGLAIHKIWGASLFDSALIVGWSTLIFGIVLGICDMLGARKEQEAAAQLTAQTMSVKHAFIIGMAQCFALIPGTSRSGITMSAARYFGFSREESARFALWLGVVAISGASVLAGLDIITSQNAAAFQKDFIIAALLSAIMAFIAIALMMRWIGKLGFMPFVIYRLILGAVILGLCYAGVLV